MHILEVFVHWPKKQRIGFLSTALSRHLGIRCAAGQKKSHNDPCVCVCMFVNLATTLVWYTLLSLLQPETEQISVQFSPLNDLIYRFVQDSTDTDSFGCPRKVVRVV